MSVTSAVVVAGNDALAAEPNALRLDILQHAGDILTDSGAADAYIVTCDAQITSLAAGQRVKFIAANANTGASTLEFKNGVALDETDAIKRKDGSALKSNDIKAGMVECIFDGTNWILMNDLARSYLLDVLNTPVTVANTTTKTALFSTTIPANELSIGNSVLLRLWVNDIDVESSADDNLFLTVELGGTVICTLGILNGGVTTNWNGIMDVILSANGATNAQKMTAILDIDNNPGSTPYSGQNQLDTSALGTTTGKSHFRIFETNAASKDSTGALSLVVYATWQGTGAGDSITAQHGEAILYKQ